jgi:hypothetical protein
VSSSSAQQPHIRHSIASRHRLIESREQSRCHVQEPTQIANQVRSPAKEDARTEDRLRVGEKEVNEGQKPVWRRRRIKVIAGVCLALGAWITLFVYHTTDIANSSIQLHLRLLGSSVYEYHAKTGQWPTRIDDLAQTSVAQGRYWRWQLEKEVVVMIWPKELRPNPKDNGSVVLAYHNKGLLAEFGRVWVCWGDLRTEYIKTKDLRAKLDANEK